MRTCWFIVIEVNHKWFVDCEGKAYGPFESRDMAVIDGTRLARTFGDKDRRAELWVSDEIGSPRRVWMGPDPARSEGSPALG